MLTLSFFIKNKIYMQNLLIFVLQGYQAMQSSGIAKTIRCYSRYVHDSKSPVPKHNKAHHLGDIKGLALRLCTQGQGLFVHVHFAIALKLFNALYQNIKIVRRTADNSHSAAFGGYESRGGITPFNPCTLSLFETFSLLWL